MILARRPTSEIKKAAREEGHAVPARVGGRAVLGGHDDAARDQQGDVRRMSPLPSFLDQSAAVGRRRDRLGPRDGGARSRGRAAARIVGGATRSSRCRAGVVDAGAERAATSTTRAALVAALRSALDKLGSRPRRVALVIPDTAAKVSLLRFEKVPARVGPRSADSLADAQGGAVQARGRADLLGAGGAAAGRRPRVSGDARRGATSSRATRARCADAGVAARARRSRVAQPDQRGAGASGGADRRRATGCCRARRPRLRHAGDRPRQAI